MHSSRMCTTRWLTVSQHALLGVYLPGGTYLRGVYLPGGVNLTRGGCTCLGGEPAQGVPARGCTCPGGVDARVYPSRYSPPREQNDRQVQKYYLAPKLRLRVVKIRQLGNTCTEYTNTDSGTYCISRFYALCDVNVVFVFTITKQTSTSSPSLLLLLGTIFVLCYK